MFRLLIALLVGLLAIHVFLVALQAVLSWKTAGRLGGGGPPPHPAH